MKVTDHVDARLLDPLRERSVDVVANADAAEAIGEGVRVLDDGGSTEL